MTKVSQSKKKKPNLSSSIGLKKTKMKAEKKLNPFEIRFTKAKHKIINRPVQAEAGKPGITRAIGIKKRKETLLQEYKLKNKTNVFIDKRIGEKVRLLE
jgi:nucleolar protein 14